MTSLAETIVETIIAKFEIICVTTIIITILMTIVYMYNSSKNLEKFAIENKCELLIVPNTNSTYWGNCKK